MIRFWLSEIRQIALILNSKKLGKIMRLRLDEIKYFSNAECERIVKLFEADDLVGEGNCKDWAIEIIKKNTPWIYEKGEQK